MKVAQLPMNLTALVERICLALQQEAAHFTSTDKAACILASQLQFRMQVDPSNQQCGFEGIWRNTHQARCGCLTLNSDLSFYAEYDLFCPHPDDPLWMVEMITAWGARDEIKTEATLIPALGEH